MVELRYDRRVFSTGELPETAQKDAWEHEVIGNHGPLAHAFPNRGEHRFGGGTRVGRLLELDGGECAVVAQVVDFASNEVRYDRTPRQVRQFDDRGARLVVGIRGSIGLTQGGVAVELTGGCCALARMSEPFTFEHDAGARGLIVTLTVPKDEEAQKNFYAIIDKAPLSLDQRRGTLPGAIALIHALAARQEHLTAHDFAAMNTRMLELLLMSLDDRRVGEVARHQEVAASVLRYVQEHSDDRRVSAQTMAAHVNFSRRTLYNIIATAFPGRTPGDLLTEHRVKRALHRLQSPLYRGSTIRDIAIASGFRSETAFREAFAHSPSGRTYGSPDEARERAVLSPRLDESS
ncbi:AraC-like DNA-binding protein [Nocardia sp. GAS34]|uniref:AraC family transcriptional regulator n=1 Tax=unclassified Nocardia TaxID=2637762 RepID=UPI003D1E032E